MPLPVDVGTLLGGRYKVTGQVLASAEQDLVLNGIDQVLNRPVSILVAAPENASQAAMSAREIATGERTGNVQVLDLGITDGYTYLITNQAEAADLLDLVIQQDAPYVEPFFTETLGSEIFGKARTYEPETYEDEDYYDEEEEDEPRASLRDRLNRLELPKLGRGNANDGAGKPLFGRRPGAGAAAGAGVAGAAAAASVAGQGRADTGQFDRAETAWQDHADTGRPESVASPRQTIAPPPPASPPHVPADADAPATAPVGRQTTGNPKVSLWQDQEDYAPAAEPARPSARRGEDEYGSAASVFPAGAGAGPTQPEDYDYDYDDDERNRPRTSRLLIGGLLGVLLIVAVVIAVNQLNLFRGGPVAGENQETNNSAPATEPQGSEETSAPAEEVVEPAIAGLSRLVPDMPELDAENDGRLPQAIDGNPATYWTSFQYQSDDFGRYASNLALVVELEESSSISSIELTQLSGSGGKFSVMLNDTASLEGATPVAQGSFTAQNTTIPVPETDGAAPKAQYVIIDFTQLPRLANPQGGPPFGIRMAEIEIS
ncbi:ABC transporter substrate-binding protein [Arthrobacter crystallopoietes]|uniref:ABC transporter substrate-binding protein n=1 Tax=Crystallibacter crystallopoietes TaxID=37928 RepID=UPI003D2277B8